MFCLEINTNIKGSKISGILFLNFHSWNCSRILENSFREFSFPGIKKSWKILSWKKIVLEFSQNNFTEKYIFLEFTVLEFSIPGIFHSWNSVLELSVPGILFHGIFLLPYFKYSKVISYVLYWDQPKTLSCCVVQRVLDLTLLKCTEEYTNRK